MGCQAQHYILRRHQGYTLWHLSVYKRQSDLTEVTTPKPSSLVPSQSSSIPLQTCTRGGGVPYTPSLVVGSQAFSPSVAQAPIPTKQGSSSRKSSSARPSQSLSRPYRVQQRYLLQYLHRPSRPVGEHTVRPVRSHSPAIDIRDPVATRSLRPLCHYSYCRCRRIIRLCPRSSSIIIIAIFALSTPSPSLSTVQSHGSQPAHPSLRHILPFQGVSRYWHRGIHT